MEFKKTGKRRTFGGKDRSEGRGVCVSLRGAVKKNYILSGHSALPPRP